MYTPILILIPHINRIGNSILGLVLQKKKKPPNKKTMARTIPRETKRGRPKKGQKRYNRKGLKRRR
jgi:hypothetical protein